MYCIRDGCILEVKNIGCLRSFCYWHDAHIVNLDSLGKISNYWFDLKYKICAPYVFSLSYYVLLLRQYEKLYFLEMIRSPNRHSTMWFRFSQRLTQTDYLKSSLTHDLKYKDRNNEGMQMWPQICFVPCWVRSRWICLFSECSQDFCSVGHIGIRH